MVLKKTYNLNIVLLTLLIATNSFATDIIKGDQELVNASFSFPIQAHVASLFGRNFYVGAHPNQTGMGNANNFALSALSRNTTEFTPLAPEKVKINGEKDQPTE